MGYEWLIADTIVDIVSEINIERKTIEGECYKKGFFLQDPYIKSKTAFKNKRTLITEKYMLEMIRKGERRISIPGDSIITPSAKMLIDEGKISIDG
jgi:hypothetical protein